MRTNNHRRAEAKLNGAELNTSSWIHTYEDGRKEKTHLISLKIKRDEARSEVSAYVTEHEIDLMIAALQKFKRNAMLTDREFALYKVEVA